jgi:outer membrane protein OmpA-like peptidoglycan-associated protein
LEVGLSAPFRSLKLPAASDYEVNGVRGRWPTDPALDEVSESGFSNVSLGLRYQVLGDTKEETGLKLTPYIQAFLPTAQDPELGNGAENTRIHFGVSAGAVLPDMMNARLYTQAAYQFATDYDQDREDFTERGWWANPLEPPRFDYFGTNPLFHEYGNTLFYGGGFALPIISNTVELFTEFLLYHSFEDPDYIPMFEDYNEPNNFEELDVVQDGGAVHVGTQIGFGNGLVLTAGWGSKLFAEEPMYESPLWRVFAGLSYNSPAEVVVRVGKVEQPEAPEERPGAEEAVEVPPEEIVGRINCDDILNLMVHFEFDKSTLTPEGIATLQQVGKLLRYCTGYTVEVQGHTDWEGTENYNIGLGNRRARAVVYYLVYDEGIDPNRVVLKEKMDRTPPVIAGETYGETQPIASNETDSGRALNRRGQFLKR